MTKIKMICICAFVSLATAGARAAELLEVVHVGSTEGREPLLNFDVESEPLARLSVEYSPDLSSPWEAWTPPVTALDGNTPISVVLTDAPGAGFFRIVVQPPRVSAVLDGDEIVLDVYEDGVSQDEILIGLSRAIGQLPNLSLLYDPDDEETLPGGLTSPIGKGTYSGGDLSHLGRALGWKIWDNAPEKDDPAIAGRYLPLETDRGTSVEFPGDGGAGAMDDGWGGDAITVLPGRLVGDPPEPGQFDMKFTPDVPFEMIRQPMGELDNEDGMHVRLLLKVDAAGFEFVEALEQDTGNGLLEVPFPVPGVGWYILSATYPSGITSLFPFEDPRTIRAYNPPQGGSHGYETASEGSLRLTLPLLQPDSEGLGLAGTEVRILRVAGSDFGDVRLLTPELVARNPDQFPTVYSVDGSEILSLLQRRKRPARAATKAPTAVTLHRSGSNGSKFNVAVMGDGFRDTVSDQDVFNTYVENTVMNTLRTRDIHPSVLNGMNIFRINTFSEESGITTVDANGAVINAVSTAIEYRYSGLWNRCWMAAGPNSQALIDAAIASVCPQADFVILVLNTAGFGGCAGGNRFNVTLGAGWSVVAHEFGHKPGTLGDEYTCGGSCGCYGGGEPSAGNLTRNTTRATLKWNTWIPSWRPLPTTWTQVASPNLDVGLFPGATIGQNQWTSCIFRPSFRGRMNNNTPTHNPVGYTNVREQFRPFQSADFRKNVVGDFNGDGRPDTVIQDGRQYALYLAGDRNVGANDPVSGSPPRGVTGVLEPTWFATDFMPNDADTAFWRGREADILLPGDFDGDGDDDLYVINHSTWNNPYVVFMKSHGDRFELVGGYTGDLPGWQRRAGDEFYVLDFNGDGRDDLVVFNGTNWSIPYLGMLRSTGAGLQMVRRYDRYLPNWEMGRHEKLHVGDFNNDGRDDLISFNRDSWSKVHLLVYRSTGTGLSLADRHYGTIPGIWQMRRKDVLKVLDFNGDESSDIALFNGLNWGPTYLAYIQSDEGKLIGSRRYDNVGSPLPGWQLQRRDRLYVANVDGDADEDLVVYNKDNWSTQYLGMLRSNGSSAAGFTATGSWQADWVNGWNLGSSDELVVADFRGSAGWDDLYIFNAGWFGMLRSYQNHFRLETIYRKWIFNHRFHSLGWW